MNMPFSPRTLLAVAASFVLALVLTPLVRAFARRYGFVAKPKSDRWHKHDGSLEPAAHRTLRCVAQGLAADIGQPVHPVSWKHSDRIAPEALDGSSAAKSGGR